MGWLEYCPYCKRKHRMENLPCPSCQGRGGRVPLIISEKVEKTCKAPTGWYECEGCGAYREHTAI